MTRWKIHPGDWIFAVLSPLLVFPVYMVTVTLLDWLAGNAFLTMRVLHDSKGRLLRDLAADWTVSLPPSMLFSGLLLVAVYLVTAGRPAQYKTITLLTGTLAGVAVYSVCVCFAGNGCCIDGR